MTDTVEVQEKKTQKTINEMRDEVVSNNALNNKLLGDDVFHGIYEADRVTRALTERNHPAFKQFTPN